MSVKVSIQSFELPAEGIQPAVLADVVDLGIQETQYGKKHKVRFVWVLAEEDSEGRQKRVFQKFTMSLNQKAGLYKTLTQMGVKVAADAKEFELEDLLGTQKQLVIGYSDGDGGKTYANVVSIMKAAAGQDVQVSDSFTRDKDKEKKSA